jgi:serine/threonine-protein kinase
LPGGKAVLFTVGRLDSPDFYDNANIDAVHVDTGERRTVLEGASMASYLPTGHLVFSRARTLFAAPFDVDRLTVTGPPAVVLEGVTGDVTTGAVHHAISGEGTLIYVPGDVQGASYALARMDRSGQVNPLSAPQRTYLELSTSPDGQRVAVVVGGVNEYDIWIFDSRRGTLSRLTFGGTNRTPRWSPDGKRVAYMSQRTGKGRLYWKAADGSGEAHLIRQLDLPENSRPFVDAWSPDGKLISLAIYNVSTRNDIWVVPVDGAGEHERFLETNFDEYQSAFSPDGRWLAYMSTESGRPEIYVQAFPGPGGKWQVSTVGGEAPRWSRNGRELFYHVGARMMAVPVETSPSFRVGTPQILFDTFFDLRTDGGTVYDVASDGKSFVMVRPSNEQSQARQVNIVLNWFDELRRLAPTSKN